MNYKSIAPASKRPRSRFGLGNFGAAALVLTLAFSTFAIYTQTAASQELNESMPTLSGRAAIDHLKKNGGIDLPVVSKDGEELQTPEALVQILTAPTLNEGGSFGRTVAISGDTLVIGTDNEIAVKNNSNSAFVFVRSGSSWVLQQELIASDGVYADDFGSSVAISGDTIVIASYWDSQGSINQHGSVYIFRRSGQTWTQHQKLVAPDLTASSQFGGSIAISGETIIVGAPYQPNQNNVRTGAAYIFVKVGELWEIQQKLVPDDGIAFDTFGAVGLQGDTAIIGAQGDDIGTNNSQGSAYVFERTGTLWSQTQKLTAPDATGAAYFGGRLEFSGNTAFIIAYGANAGIHVFVNGSSGFTHQQKIIAPVGAISISGESVLFGNTAESVGGNSNQGAAYIYSRCGTTWTQQERLVAAAGAANDRYGTGVALDGNTAVVGATRSFQTGGAAYVYDVGDPLSRGAQCQIDIVVNTVTDDEDVNVGDGICDTDAGASGPQCSMRAAIQTANSTAGTDFITFDIPGTGVRTITPDSELPAITDKVFINGITQPGYTDKPLIEIAGIDAGSFARGLVFTTGSDGSRVNALTINRFQGVGIRFGSHENTLSNSYIGLGADGVTTYPGIAGQSIGVEIAGARNQIGGDRNAGMNANNFLGGNTLDQIRITSAAAVENKIYGNDIGYKTNGVRDGAISPRGINITSSASANRIGDTTAIKSNAISASFAGIAMGGNAGSNLVTFNLIDRCLTGVLITDSSGNQIGGVTTSADNREGNNLISNEKAIMVDASAPDESGFSPSKTFGGAGASANNKILGNAIRLLDASATPSIGIAVGTAENTLIGGANGNGNVILGQTDSGILIRKDAVGTIIRGNGIGIRAEGVAEPNTIGIRLGGSGTQVQNNFISGNTDFGVSISRLDSGDPLPTGNTLSSNRIGTNQAGTAAVANGSGIVIEGTQNSVTGNLISGNTEDGIMITETQILSHKIGSAQTQQAFPHSAMAVSG